jgi:hypothetical protein
MGIRGFRRSPSTSSLSMAHRVAKADRRNATRPPVPSAARLRVGGTVRRAVERLPAGSLGLDRERELHGPSRAEPAPSVRAEAGHQSYGGGSVARADEHAPAEPRQRCRDRRKDAQSPGADVTAGGAPSCEGMRADGPCRFVGEGLVEAASRPASYAPASDTVTIHLSPPQDSHDARGDPAGSRQQPALRATHAHSARGHPYGRLAHPASHRPPAASAR